MAYLILLFLDLGLPIAAAGNDDGPYRQAMIDHHLKGRISSFGKMTDCILQGVPLRNGKYSTEARFSHITWTNEGAWFQINASDAIYCSLYRKSGASYQLVRELRLPAATP